jgi:Ca-activated chloride channel family protein
MPIDLSRLSGTPIDPNISDPTIVTPSDAHWLVSVNHQVGRAVVDLSAALIIVRPFVGIVTYQDMAECLGWPDKEIGYGDIIALRRDPRGWASYPCAKAEWGQRPLVAYTDPITSSTGRNVLLALYSMAAGKTPEQLTTADVNDPEVVAYLKQFQGLVDHYLIGTTVLNTKIYQGPRYGHFFIMPEDNLIHLYEGTERAFINGKPVTAPPITRRMVMIYPKEGSMPRNNCACIVQADWVTQEQVEAARKWINFIREAEQQRSFMAAGFRPGTDLSLTDPSTKINGRYGLDPTKPTVVLNPSLIDPAVAAEIDKNWEDVKKPGIVTFVVDTSTSMKGTKLQQAKDGLIRALDSMAKNNQVGLVTFDDVIRTSIPVAPLSESRLKIADAVHKEEAQGEGALYDAIKAGIEETDKAGGDADSIRGVVVLTDGRANRGRARLDDLIKMMSRAEVPIQQYAGFPDSVALDTRGSPVAKEEIIGTGLAIKTRYPIQIFFVGIGDDADIQVGRVLAEATGAEFQGATAEDLANVLEAFGKYF